MDDETSRAAARLDRVAEGIQMGMAVLVGLLVAFVASMTLLYVLFGWLLGVLFGVDGSDGSD
ncbi:MAG TPA: hypothetical protein VK488_02010 [Gaiellaceae bacterium]|nr:hypothetical protein [Gaiellaceae bacterium]